MNAQARPVIIVSSSTGKGGKRKTRASRPYYSRSRRNLHLARGKMHVVHPRARPSPRRHASEKDSRRRRAASEQVLANRTQSQASSPPRAPPPAEIPRLPSRGQASSLPSPEAITATTPTKGHFALLALPARRHRFLHLTAATRMPSPGPMPLPQRAARAG